MKKHLNRLSKFVGFIVILGACSDNSEPVEDMVDIQSFEELLEYASNDPDSVSLREQIDNLLDSQSIPLVEADTIAYFIYQGSASRVGVAGDFNSWNPNNHTFQKVDQTNLWYKKVIFEANARLDYKLVLNGSNWILDPKEPKQDSRGIWFQFRIGHACL